MGRLTNKLIKTVWLCSEDIEMGFGILKCAVVSLPRDMETGWEGIQLEEISEADVGGYKY